MAALVAQTSGIPLKIPIDGNSYTGYGESLAGAYSLGMFYLKMDIIIIL